MRRAFDLHRICGRQQAGSRALEIADDRVRLREADRLVPCDARCAHVATIQHESVDQLDLGTSDADVVACDRQKAGQEARRVDGRGRDARADAGVRVLHAQIMRLDGLPQQRQHREPAARAFDPQRNAFVFEREAPQREAAAQRAGDPLRPQCHAADPLGQIVDDEAQSGFGIPEQIEARSWNAKHQSDENCERPCDLANHVRASARS